MESERRPHLKRTLSLLLCALFFFGGMFAREIDATVVNERAAKQQRELALLLFVVTFLTVQVMGTIDFVMQRFIRAVHKVARASAPQNPLPHGSPFSFCIVAGSAAIAFALGCWSSILWRGPEFFWSGLVAFGAGSGLFLGAVLWLLFGRKTKHISTLQPGFILTF